jgi:hypothetical protein
MLVCPMCAVACDTCITEVSTHTDDDGERFCDACWEMEQRRIAVLEVVAVSAPANCGMAVAR